MNKIAIILLAVGGTLLALGLVIYMTLFFTQKRGLEVKTTSYQLEENINSINIDLVESNINIIKSNDGKNRVEFEETNKFYHKVELKDGTLDITRESIYHPFEFLFPHFSLDMSVSLYLNEQTFNKISVETVSGKISVDFLKTSDLKIKTVSGRITLENVICKENMNIKTVSGAVSLLASEAKNINIKTVSGSLNLNLLTGKEYDVKTISGKKELDEVAQKNGYAYLETVSGNITVTIG